jgi:rhodanese-related sulfurtransferase
MFFNSTPSISTAEAAKHIGEQGVGFIDVRTSAEYTSGHAENAVNYPLQEFSPALIERLKKYETVYVICQSGGRSATATSQLRNAKINAINVSGGTSAWQANRLPMQ